MLNQEQSSEVAVKILFLVTKTYKQTDLGAVYPSKKVPPIF